MVEKDFDVRQASMAPLGFPVIDSWTTSELLSPQRSLFSHGERMGAHIWSLLEILFLGLEGVLTELLGGIPFLRQGK